MAKIKGKGVVISDIEIHRESSPTPPKLQIGIVINEPSKHQTNLRSSIHESEQLRKKDFGERIDIRSKLVLPYKDQSPTYLVLLIITTRALNRIKAAGEQTILEERKLSTNGVLRWVQEFYASYKEALPKKRNGIVGKPWMRLRSMPTSVSSLAEHRSTSSAIVGAIVEDVGDDEVKERVKDFDDEKTYED
uniref:Uncharacterized protein n=1 Tax=Solanum tuberosum TaxID=4113 RepID=M1DIS9_SOLTU